MIKKRKGFVWSSMFVLGIFGIIIVGITNKVFASTAATFNLPFPYTYGVSGQLGEAASDSLSGSAYWWVNSGADLIVSNGVGATLSGALPSTNNWYKIYATKSTVSTDGGAHPQNLFLMFLRDSVQNPSTQIYINRVTDNLSNSANRQPYIGESIISRYQDSNNYYYAGLRADGAVVIKKKTNGVFQTLASKKIFAGTYNSSTNYDLIPLNQWIGLKFVVLDSASGVPSLTLYTDIGRTGTWQVAASATDDPSVYGSPINNAGTVGIQSDYADAQFDDFLLSNAGGVTVTPTPAPAPTPSPTPAPTPAPTTSYDSAILSDSPVMYLTMGSAASGSEIDLTGQGHNGVYKGGTPITVSLPNGDNASDFNGTSQYLTVPSSAALSIATTHQFTWEGWIRADSLQFANASGDGYVDWMGKCENYSPTCEWEARAYSSDTSQGRPNRLSAYVFNPSAGLGSAADWQPATGVIQQGQWLHVVAEYQTLTTPSGCSTAYPGSINIWVNGVEQSAASHFPTGCMSQYSITPRSNNSPLDIGTMAMDTWFKGAVGKVAVYNYLLSPTQISNHYSAMTSKQVTGSCGATCTF